MESPDQSSPEPNARQGLDHVDIKTRVAFKPCTGLDGNASITGLEKLD
jgi:hypothetical protein